VKTDTLSLASSVQPGSPAHAVVRGRISMTPAAVVTAFVVLLLPMAKAQDGERKPEADPPAATPAEVSPPPKVLDPRTRMRLQLGAGIRRALTASRQAAADSRSVTISVNEELQGGLAKAMTVSAERPDLAPLLWQRLLDESASAIAKVDDSSAITARRAYETYGPFSDQVLSALVAAGPEALRHYRLQSDGPARALLATAGPGREAALQEIVRRYFLTSAGDNAAFELGCLLLERGNDISASLMFDRLSEFPDSDVPADDVLSRRAVAQARLARFTEADALVASMSSSMDGLKPLLSKEIVRLRDRSQGRTDESRGATPLAGELQPEWEYRPPWTLKGIKQTTDRQAIMTGVVNGRAMIYIRQPGGNYVQANLEEKEIPNLSLDQLAEKWRSSGWRPASNPILSDGRVYLKSESRTLCCDATTGKLLWMGRPTRFPVDEWSRELAQVAAHGVSVSVPTVAYTAGTQARTLTEMMLFSDRLHHGLTVVDGRVFAVEGPLDTPAARKALSDAIMERGFSTSDRHTMARHNELACYDAASGRLLWNIARGAGLDDNATVWSTPLVVDSSVVIAIGLGSQLQVTAFSTVSGEHQWTTPLFDTSRAPPTVPVGFAVDQGSIYVASGAGMVFALDRQGGSLRWAVTYPRTRSLPAGDRRLAEGATSRIQIVLDENHVVLNRGAVVVAAADSDHVMAFDVENGRLLWDSPLLKDMILHAPGYVVGNHDGRLVLGSASRLWSVRLQGGRIEWEAVLEASCGRGLVTGNEVLVPQGRNITRFNLATGSSIGEIPVQTPDGEPVGNLIVDQGRLYLASAARLFLVRSVNPSAQTPPQPTAGSQP
jgi:outer membrane protein assembly factor BamB